MKRFISEKSTDELLSLGMALHADKDTMETRIHGIFSRKRSSWIAMSIAFVLALSMGIVCFTTKVQPVTAKQNEVEVLQYNNEKTEVVLPTFSGVATAKSDGNRVTVSCADGKEINFTVIEEVIQKDADVSKEGFVTLTDVGMEAGRVATMIYGDALDGAKIRIKLMESLDRYEFVIHKDGTKAKGIVDAKSGMLLKISVDSISRSEEEYGREVVNEKLSSYDWEANFEAYEAVKSPEKAYNTAVELVEKCFPTGKIIPVIENDFETASYVDGEQIAWFGSYVSLVDVYLKMEEGPCYAVRVAVPIEGEGNAWIEVFSAHESWDDCKDETF